MYKKLAFSLLLASLFFCFSNTMATTVDRIAAVVNGDIITESELSAALTMYQRDNRPTATRDADVIRREVLDKMIDDLLLRSAIDKAKITVDDNDLARAISNVLRINRITLEQLRADLAAKGVSYEMYTRQIAEQIRMVKFTNQIIGSQIKLSDRELRDFYDRNRERFGGSSGTFEAARDNVYEALYDEKVEELLHNYILGQRQKAYVDIR